MDTVSTITGRLKEVYSPDEVKNLWVKGDDTIGKIKEANEAFDGESWVLNHGTKTNERGIGVNNEQASLRETGSAESIKPKVYPKYFYARGKMSGPALEKGKKGKDASFVGSLMVDTIDTLFERGKKELNCQFFRGGSGIIAKVNGAVSADTTITFDTGHSSHLRVGMFIDIYNGSTKQADSVEIVDVDPINLTIEVGTAVTVSDNANIYREDVYSASTNPELAGLPQGSDDGTDFATFQNITIASNPLYKGIVYDASGSNFALDMLLRMDQRTRTRGGNRSKVLVSNEAQQRKYVDLVVPHIEYKQGQDDYGIGFDMVPKVMGKTWLTDIDCPEDVMYGMNWDALRLGTLRPYSLDLRGGDKLRDLEDVDAYEFRHTFYGNLIYRDRRDFWRIENLAVPSR